MGRRSEVLIEFVREHRILPFAIRGWMFRQNWEDFAQVALLSVWQTLQEYDDSEEFPLQKIAAIRARNAVVEEYRRKFSRKKKDCLDDAFSFHGNLYEESGYDPRDEGTDSNFVNRLTLWDELDERLRSMPLKWAAIIRPYFYDGLTITEIAEMTGYTRRWVWQLLKYGRFPSRNNVAPGTISSPERRLA